MLTGVTTMNRSGQELRDDDTVSVKSRSPGGGNGVAYKEDFAVGLKEDSSKNQAIPHKYWGHLMRESV